jgi:hypothetical protein
MTMPPPYEQAEKTRPDAPEYLPHGFPTPGVTATQRRLNLSAYKALPPGPEVLVRQAGKVTLRHADFPIWRVSRGGAPVPHAGPLITFDATPGVYRVERVLLWQEIVGAAISWTSALGLAAVLLRRRRYAG